MHQGVCVRDKPRFRHRSGRLQCAAFHGHEHHTHSERFYTYCHFSLLAEVYPSLGWFRNYKIHILLITRYAWTSEHRTHKLPILFSDEARQNSVVLDEKMVIILRGAILYLLKPLEKSTTYVSWYYDLDRHTVIKRQKHIVHGLSKYQIVSTAHSIVDRSTSLTSAFARLICTGEIDPVPMAFRHIFWDARC